MAKIKGLPPIKPSDNGKFLSAENGAAVWKQVQNTDGVLCVIFTQASENDPILADKTYFEITSAYFSGMQVFGKFNKDAYYFTGFITQGVQPLPIGFSVIPSVTSESVSSKTLKITALNNITYTEKLHQNENSVFLIEEDYNYGILNKTWKQIYDAFSSGMLCFILQHDTDNYDPPVYVDIIQAVVEEQIGTSNYSIYSTHNQGTVMNRLYTCENQIDYPVGNE